MSDHEYECNRCGGDSTPVHNGTHWVTGGVLCLTCKDEVLRIVTGWGRIEDDDEPEEGEEWKVDEKRRRVQLPLVGREPVQSGSIPVMR